MSTCICLLMHVCVFVCAWVCICVYVQTCLNDNFASIGKIQFCISVSFFHILLLNCPKKSQQVNKGIIKGNSGQIDKNILPYFPHLNSWKILGFSIRENYFLSLILDAKVMEISSLDSSFLIQHPITINITAVSASQAAFESKQELYNLSLTVMQEEV